MSYNPRLTSTATDEGTTTYSYLFADKVGSISKGSESFSFTYDGTLLTGITQSGILNQAIGYSYNNDFLPSSMTYAGATQSYAYDDDGLLVSVGAMAIAPYILTRDTANGFVTTITDGTLTQHRSYNSYGEITQVSDDTFTYELSQRDSAGAITQKKETLSGTTEAFDYSYDEMGRLTEVKRNNTLVESYTYDPNGNRASATINGTTTTASYTLDDQLVVYGDNAYRYNDDGYLQTKTTPEGETTYSYGTMGELLSVSTPAKTITYKHNALNQRVAKLVDGQVSEKYLWADLTTLLAVYDEDDNLIQRFEYADQRMPIAMTDKDGNKYYLHYDQVGSLRAVSDTNHNIIKELTYDTYGNLLTDSNPSFKVPFGFAGGLYDADTGLTRFGYRDYDAYTGKWTAKDPIGFAGGDSNLYGYVLGDPVGLTDSRGLDWFNDFANFSAGLGDALLLGFGDNLRSLLNIEGVDQCSNAYGAGSWASFGFGGARLTYAGLAKAGSIFASTGQAASAFRNSIKNIFRLGMGKNFRKPNLAGKTEAQLRRSSGRTHPGINSYGVGITYGALFGSEDECQ